MTTGWAAAILLAGCQSAAPPTTSQSGIKATIAAHRPAIGEQLPDVTVHSLNGAPHPWSQMWANSGDGALLLVIGVDDAARVATFPAAFAKDTNPEVLFVAGSQKAATLAKRLSAANRLAKVIGQRANGFDVDGIDNSALRALGGASAKYVLVNSNGVVLARADSPSDPVMIAAIRAATDANDRNYRWRQLQSKNFESDDKEQASFPACDGDVAAVAVQIAKSPQILRRAVWQSPGTCKTLLQWAVDNRRLEVAKFLITHGAEVNAESADAPLPLLSAARLGDVAMVRLLLANGAEVNLAAVDHGPTPLDQALLFAHRDVADILKQAGAKPSFFTQIAEGESSAVKQAIAEDATIAMRPDGWHRPPLVYAAAGNQAEMVKLLQSAEAYDIPYDPVAFSNDGSAMLKAVQLNNIAMMQLLHATGSSSNMLSDAVYASAPETVHELIVLGADPNQPNLEGTRPLYAAAATGNAEMLQLLLDAGAKVNIDPGEDRGPQGPPSDAPLLNSPLHEAARAASPQCVALLLQHGASITKVDLDGQIPLQTAADNPPSADRLKVIKLLLAAGADINAGVAGNTPLDLAESAITSAKSRDTEIAVYLKSHGGRE